MAKFNASGVGGDIRGKLGNSVFSRNKGGAIIRQKVTPNNPRTAAQQLVRQNFGQNSKAWSGTLTQSQRDAWTAFAAANPVRNVFGNTITITGLAMYNRLNQILLQIGASIILDPPVAYSVVQAPSIGSLVIDEAGPQYTFTKNAGLMDVTTDYYVFATSGLAVGKTPNQNLYRFIGAFHTTASVSTDISIASQYEAVFGIPAVGTQVWADIAQVNNTTGAVLTGVVVQTIVA
jgi:hypothetical protein